MTQGDIAAIVSELERSHAFDRDGGYDLAEDLANLLRSMDDHRRTAFRDYLLGVIDEEGHRWSVVLEALVAETAHETAVHLEKLLRSDTSRSPYWRQEVLTSLIRLGYPDALDLCLPYIQSGLQEDRSTAIIALAHLYRVAPQTFLTLAPQYFADRLSLDDSGLQVYMPTFIWNLAQADESALVRLIRLTATLDDQSGRALATMILAGLHNPLVVHKLGQGRVNVQRELVARELARDKEPGKQ